MTNYINNSNIKVIAHYFPQFHVIPENEQWWGENFTDWTNVKKAKSLFPGHYQPHIPDDYLGYYDLSDTSVQKKQIELAKEYGIYGFCFYAYWFNGKRLLEKPLDNYLTNPDLDFPFCICWANENWSRIWDGRDQDILIEQKHSPEDDIEFIKHMSKYIKDPRYIKIDKKPLILVYRPEILPNPKETASRWRIWCRENDVGEIYLAYTQSFCEINPNEFGFDAASEFPPNDSGMVSDTNEVLESINQKNELIKTNILTWNKFLEKSENYKKKNYTLFRCIMPSWDNTARRKNNAYVITDSSPKNFEKMAKNAFEYTFYNHRDEERIVFVNAWNEWGEGCHLEPDKKYGYSWLQSIKNAQDSIHTENNTYLSKIEHFNKIYNTNTNQIISDPKIEYRYFCYRYINYIKNITLPEIKLNLDNEAVLIECRKFPHLEFIIRNTIIKLGSNWSYTVLCGKLNYDYMLDMCQNISPNIKVIRVPFENFSQSTYSEYLTSLEFWNLLVGSKILIYHEDSSIFSGNIDDFMHWDFIGAPFPKTQNDNNNLVGNGGFSLRTKQCMIDVIKTIDIYSTVYNSDTLLYMKHCGMSVAPEDVYFSLNMLRYGIGRVADWDSASKFSSESINNPTSLGAHCIWISNDKWKHRLYNQTVRQFKPRHKINLIDHRGGWKTVIENLEDKDFFNKSSIYTFYDLMEHDFLWRTDHKCENKWFGVVHCTHNPPPHLDSININKLFDNKNFIDSLDNCVCIISLSKYVAKFLTQKLQSIHKYIPIKILKHPTELKNIKLFTIKNYIANNNKKIIQIGQQCRKLTSIYQLKTKLDKVWLTGNKNLDYCNRILENEQNILQTPIDKNTVKMYYTSTEEEYDDLLSKNIVFIDLFDASANNTVVECIARNTPIIVNKLPAVVEYLGSNYPLYFKDLNDIDKLLSIDKLTQAHEYLKNMNKKDLDIDFFTKELFKLTRRPDEHCSKIL